jgi:hypothetical protein
MNTVDVPLSHRWAVTAVEDALQLQRPSDVCIFHNTAVHVRDFLWSPDLIAVKDETPFHDGAYDSFGVLLAVGIAAPVARTGIASYWQLGPDLALSSFELKDGLYELVTRAGAGDQFTVALPWPISFSTAHLALP